MRDFIGQRRLLARLSERALRGDVAHAYELSGPRSIGKRTVAIRLAQTLLCTSEPHPAGGCGTCLACRKIDHQTHPDVRMVGRLVDLEKENDRKQIAIEQIREMQQDLALRPLEGRWRVVVIDDAADLSEHAEVYRLVSSGLTERFAWAADVAESDRDPQKRNEAIETRLAEWCELARDAAVAPHQVGRALRPERVSESDRLAKAVSQRELVDFALALERWRRDMVESNVNARMLLELLVLKLPYAATLREAA